MFVKGQKHVVDKKFWTQTLNNMDLFSAAFAFVAGQHSTFAASTQPLDAALVTRSCVHAKLPGMDKREGKKARGAEEDEVGRGSGRHSALGVRFDRPIHPLGRRGGSILENQRGTRKNSVQIG